MAVANPPPTYADPVLVDERTRKSQFNPIWLKWFLDLAQTLTNSGAGSGGAIDHQSLVNLQGGGSTERYHLTAQQNSDLTAGFTGTGSLVRQVSPTLTTPSYLYSYQQPATGFSITVGNTITTLILEPAGALATGTITMPAAPADGQEVRISSTQNITALTVSPNTGQTVKNAPTAFTVSLTGDQGYAFIYRASNTTWYRLQ